MAEGFIGIERNFVDNFAWYDDGPTVRLYFHLRLIASYKDCNYKGYEIPRGTCVVSVESLSAALKLSVQKIRTALKHLESTNDITIKTTSKFSIITVIDYDKWRETNNQNNNQTTNNQQTTNKQLTTLEESKKVRNKKSNINIGNSSASYDIDAAVLRANTTVPTVRKRERNGKAV